jgi:hypothetical protein
MEVENDFSLLNQKLSERKRYLEILQKLKYSSGEINEWLD